MSANAICGIHLCIRTLLPASNKLQHETVTTRKER